MELQTGRSDMVISGGLDTFNDIFMYMCFSKTPGAFAPPGGAKPFSADGDGTILGEGLGLVMLKRLEDAERDGDKIYAVIKGIGTSSDGKGKAIYEPSANGQTKALLEAYKLADVTPDTIELVEGHGTGTKVGDATEAKALSGVFSESSDKKNWCAIGSVKSNIGHTKAAAGAAGLIKTALALQNKVLPPTIKISDPLPEVAPGNGPLYINTEKRPWISRSEHPRRAGISAFGFGGSNYHCLLEEHKTIKEKIDWDGNIQLLAYSANSSDELLKKISALKETSDWKSIRRSAASSRNTYDSSANCRLLIVLEKDRSNFNKQIASAKKQLQANKDKSSWNTPDGICFGSGKVQGKVAALFPGQGSQYPRMFSDLACKFPQLLDMLALADEAIADERLSDCIYPIPVFDDASRKQQIAGLQATRNAQPRHRRGELWRF